MDYKSETKKSYNSYPEIYNQKFQKHFDNLVKPEAELFVQNLKGKELLDLGSGPGNHAEFFMKKGLKVLCADISEEMVEKCRQKGLKAEVMDIENLDLPAGRFDGIWAYASLLHVPREKIPGVIDKIAAALKPGGLLGLALKEGTGEAYEENYKYPGTKRYFVYFDDAGARKFFEKHFKVLRYNRSVVKGKHTFLLYIMELKI